MQGTWGRPLGTILLSPRGPTPLNSSVRLRGYCFGAFAVTFAFGSVAHDVFFDDDPAGAPASIPGAVSNTSVARTFTTAGEYTFDCHIHPGMRGSVTVVAPDTL